jgi:hypothetical protein
MQWGEADKDGFIRYPVGLVISLPFLIHVANDLLIPVWIDDYRCTLIFKRQTRNETFFKARVPFNIEKIDFIGGKAAYGIHYSEAYIFFTEVEVKEDGSWHFKSVSKPPLEAFLNNVIMSEVRLKRFKNNAEYAIIDVALALLNTFISQYRFETHHYFIPDIRCEDLFAEKFLSFSFQPTYPPEYSDINFSSQVLYSMDCICGKRQDISEEQLQNIYSRLKSNQLVPVVDELLVAANDHFNKGNYRLAIIEIETAFEVAIGEVVRKYYIERGKTQEEVTKIFKAGFGNILLTHYPNCPGAKPFTKGSSEYKDWYWAYEKRNLVVHRGGNISEEEAFKAFSIFDKTFKYLLDGKSAWFSLDMPPIPLG